MGCLDWASISPRWAASPARSAKGPGSHPCMSHDQASSTRVPIVLQQLLENRHRLQAWDRSTLSQELAQCSAATAQNRLEFGEPLRAPLLQHEQSEPVAA